MQCLHGLVGYPRKDSCLSYKTDITVIGAGVVGLAVAAKLVDQPKEVFVLEKNETFGQETSSRHSGVIHAGIYYPESSLKARLCVEGNRILYQLCSRYDIGHRRLGKLIVATNESEIPDLENLLDRGSKNGARDLRMLSRQDVKRLEPNVSAVRAILSPSTGIIDGHALMKYFVAKIIGKGGQVAYKTKVVSIEQTTEGYKVGVEDNTGRFYFVTRILVNCAGLYSDDIAEMAGIDIAQASYRLHYCKGEYFSAGSSNCKLVKRLIYPVPLPEATGLGIHTTFDLDGRMRLGPNTQYVDKLDYKVDSEHKKNYCDAVRRYLPMFDCSEVEPEMAGIRPKLQEPGGKIRDFVIRDESDKGLRGFINLIGIESPGLTASPAIAEYVSNLVEVLLIK